MPTEGIFNNTFFLLERSLNLRILRHRVLASNIANMDTPNYKAVELSVEEEINKKRRTVPGIPFGRTHSNHFSIKNESMEDVQLKVADPPEFSLRGDGNTVNIDRTMGKLAQNTLLYNTATLLISKKLKGLKNAISGGK